MGETGEGVVTEVGQPGSGNPDPGRHFQPRQVCPFMVPIRLGAAGIPAPGWNGGLWDRVRTMGERV